MLCKAISYFYITFSTCRIARIPKCLYLSQISGNTSLYDEHHVSNDLFPFGLNCYKINKRSSSTSRLGLLWWKWLTLLKCNHSSGIHLNAHQCTFRCIPVVRYTWLIYPLEFLWSEVWKCYINCCNPTVLAIPKKEMHSRDTVVLTMI